MHRDNQWTIPHYQDLGDLKPGLKGRARVAHAKGRTVVHAKERTE